MASGDLGNLLITVMIAVIIIGLGGFILLDIGASQPTAEVGKASVDITAGAFDLPSGGFGEIDSVTVAQTLGTSVELNGQSNARVTGDLGTDHDQTWSVSVWAIADQSRTQRAVQLDGWLYIDLVNTSTDEWRVTYYDEADLTVHQLTVTADSPTSWTNLVVTGNESTMAVYQNNSFAGETSLATGGASIPDAENWDGRVEELRTYDTVVDSDTRQTLYDTPTAPTENETARVYFDAWSTTQTSVPVYWTGSSLDLDTNASISKAGFDGQSVDEGDDYQINGDVVEILSGGTLDGAPVAFTQITTTGSSGGAFAADFAEAVSSIVRILSLMILVVAMGYLMLLRDR